MPSNAKARRHKHTVKLMEINEMLAQIKAVPLHTKERVYTIQHISIGQLRMLFKRKQNPVPDQGSQHRSDCDFGSIIIRISIDPPPHDPIKNLWIRRRLSSDRSWPGKICSQLGKLTGFR